MTSCGSRTYGNGLPVSRNCQPDLSALPMTRPLWAIVRRVLKIGGISIWSTVSCGEVRSALSCFDCGYEAMGLVDLPGDSAFSVAEESILDIARSQVISQPKSESGQELLN